MAMIESAPRAPFGALTIHRVVATVERVIVSVRESIAAGRTAAELSRLSPRLREDIGIQDQDIAAYWHKSLLL